MTIAGVALLIAGLTTGVTALWAAGIITAASGLILLLAGYAARTADREG